MASISKDPGGRRTIQFTGADGRRRSIRLGKVSQRVAENVKVRVEQLNAALISGQAPDSDALNWLADLDSVMRDKLARVGLCEAPKARGKGTLDAFLDHYFALRHDVKPNTRRVWTQTRRLLVNYFGADKPLDAISPFDAKAWRLHLIGLGLAEASVRKHCGFAKHFFAQAVDKEIIARSPFAKLPSSSIGNDKRQQFVTPEEIGKVIDACPNAEWKLIVALSRYGGLRCPSEHLALRWGDVDWANDRIAVRSPKTERMGKDCRIVPLFPELRPYLEAAFDAAPEGTEFVITGYRDPDANLRQEMTRIVWRAGLIPWPRIFHNLRASRQTELEETFPTHVVCAWIGNTQTIARKHYLQVTDDHYHKATQAACGALQNPVQSSPGMRRKASQPANAPHEETAVREGLRERAVYCSNEQRERMGIEPTERLVQTFRRF